MSKTNEMVQSVFPSPIGELHAFACERGVRAILFHDSDFRRHGVDGEVPSDSQHPVLKVLEVQLREYFAGERRIFDVPLDAIGTPFQLLAWRALREIPFGETRSYGEQARAIARPSSVRATAAANGRNPLTIVVPCHRVIAADGKLTGFAGGLHRKRALLEHEGVLRPSGELPFDG